MKHLYKSLLLLWAVLAAASLVHWDGERAASGPVEDRLREAELRLSAMHNSKTSTIADLRAAQDAHIKAQRDWAEQQNKQDDKPFAVFFRIGEQDKDGDKDGKGGAGGKKMRGARRTPPHKIAAALLAGKIKLHKAGQAIPKQVAMVPPKLSMWGNSQYGDCVSAEWAFAIAGFSVYSQGNDKEIFVSEQAVISWASKHGFLNGADLLEVIQAAEADGIKDENGVARKAGTPSVVDYTSEPILQSAIAQGPVSIAIDANALPGGAGNASGWFDFSGSRFPNTDHCVSLAGYGPADWLFKQLNTAVPANAPASAYLLFTWNTIGVVNHAWIKGTCVEAWLRTPTVVGLDPPPPPSSIVVAVGDAAGQTKQPVTLMPLVTGATLPLTWKTSWGDGISSGTLSHAYDKAGTYAVAATVTDAAGASATGSCVVTVTDTPPSPPPPPSPIPGGSDQIVITLSGVTRTYTLISQNEDGTITIGGQRFSPLPGKKGK